MGFELILFIAAILFGILLYWRETKGNNIYRFFNKIFNSKELQMKATNKKGFVYQQPFLLRLVYIAVFFLVALIVFQFFIPIGINGLSFFASMIAGTLIGTYIATVIFKSTEIIEEQTENIEEMVQDTLDKGKDLIEDIKDDVKELTDADTTKETPKDTPKENKEAPEKSARERLKDKGLL